MSKPTQKTIRARTGSRRAHHALKRIISTVCESCGTVRLRHRACPSCGMYRGRKTQS